MAMARLVHESLIAYLRVTDLVILPTYFAIEPKRVSSAQARPGGIEAALQDVRRGHV